MHQPQKSYTVEEAKRKLERYCVYQERSHQEVQKKLREMRMIPIAIDEIIGHLIAHNFLNETRFAQAFARGKFNIKKWGKNRIVRELKQRNVSAYNIKLALKEISEAAYIETFHTLAEKRWQALTSETNLQNPPAERARKKKKFVDYMMYRGWESSRIWEKVKDLENDDR